MARTPITSVRIPPEVKALATARADDEQRTLADVVNTLLDLYGKGVIDA